MEEWGPERAAELADLLRDVMSGEALSADEVQNVCWDDPRSAVLGSPDGSSAVAGVVRETGPTRTGFVRLIAVHPGRRRMGEAAGLLRTMEGVLVAGGAQQFQLGGESPRFLWPGIDTRWTAAQCLAEAAGYSAVGAEVNMSCPTTFRTPDPDGFEVRRIIEESDVAAALGFCEQTYPWWSDELARGIEQGGAFGAFESKMVYGFAAHSVNRDGWVGPMATDPDAQGRGIGAALLGELCRDLMVAGRSDAEICWVGPVSFYAKTAGAAVSRVFRVYRKPVV